MKDYHERQQANFITYPSVDGIVQINLSGHIILFKMVYNSYYWTINMSGGQFTPGQYTPERFTPGQFTPGQFTPGQFTPGLISLNEASSFGK